MARITDLPESERPIERLHRTGADSLSTIELVSLLLRTGSRQENAKELAASVLERFPLPRMARTDVSVFMDFHGIGRTKAARLTATFELARRYHLAVSETVSSFDEAERLLGSSLRGLDQEEFHVALLTSANTVIDTTALHRGSLKSLDIDVREIVRVALTYNAAAVILGHNHPGGNAEPSEADIRTTERVERELGNYDITVLDHIIFGQDKTTSLRQQGVIS